MRVSEWFKDSTECPFSIVALRISLSRAMEEGWRHVGSRSIGTGEAWVFCAFLNGAKTWQRSHNTVTCLV